MSTVDREGKSIGRFVAIVDKVDDVLRGQARRSPGVRQLLLSLPALQVSGADDAVDAAGSLRCRNRR